MPVRIDPLAQQAEVGGRTYRLRLDCRAEAALVTVGEREYRVGLLEWRQKAMLSRFTSLGETLVMREFVRLCTDTTEELPQETATVLWEVAAWINDPSRAGAAVPFDRRSVATVTLQLCRAMQLRPADFDGRTAVEVEEMWQALNSENRHVAAPPEAASSSANRIVILPDPEPPATAPERVEETTHHDLPPVGRAEIAPAPSAASPTEAPQATRSSAPFRLLQPARVGTQREATDVSQNNTDTNTANIVSASHTVNNETPAGQAHLTERAAPHPGPLPAGRGEGTEPAPEPQTTALPHALVPTPLSPEPATNPVPSPRYGGERVRVRGGSRAALDPAQPATTTPTLHADDGVSIVSSDRGGTPPNRIVGTPASHHDHLGSIAIDIDPAPPVFPAFVRREPDREMPRPIAAHLVANQHHQPLNLASKQPAGETPRQPARVASFRPEPMDVIDNESLFDELADRLAEAAADMGIGEV